MDAIVLDRQSEAIQHLCKRDKRLARVIGQVGAITYSPHPDPYRFLVETIVGQMLSNKVAAVLAARFEALCNGDITPEAVATLRDEDIRGIGISLPKVSYIRQLTTCVQTGQLSFANLAALPDKEVIAALTAIRGVGAWSAKMYLIFVLDRQDVLPIEDGAFLQSYRWLYNGDGHTPPQISKKCKKWKPYASVAARYLYRALDTGLVKSEFHLYKE